MKLEADKEQTNSDHELTLKHGHRAEGAHGSTNGKKKGLRRKHTNKTNNRITWSE